MASTAKPEANVSQVCLICLDEAEHLKVVGECQHAFCQACLQSHLKGSDSKEAVLSCPSCHCESPIPEGGIGTLPDFVPAEAKDTADKVGEVSTGHDEVEHVTNDVEDEETTEVPQKDCTVCSSKEQHATSCAKRFCEECDMYLCEGCSDVHGGKSSTKSHVLTVVGAANRSSAGICGQHDDRPLKMFCRPCAMPCCGLCVANDHDDHDVCTIKDMLDAAVSRLEKVMEQGKSRVNYLDIKESAVFSTRKAKLEWKKTVIRTIEEKSEECVNNILKQKEELLKTIREECDTSDEEEYLHSVKRIRKNISAQVDEGARLLSRALAGPKYLKRVSEMEDAIAKELVSKANIPPDDIAVDCTRPMSFLEESDPVGSIGSMSKNALLQATKLHGLQLPTDMEFVSIPEVRCLGELGYAAICRQELAEFPDQLVIFDKDGKLQNVERDLPRVSGMAVDAQDRTVLLLPSKNDGFFLIRVYDTERSTFESTKDLLLPKPLSMAASPEGFYVLSEGSGGNRIITSLDTKGNIAESTSIAYPAEIRYHNRIACSSKCIYTTGTNMASSIIATFRIIDKRITLWNLIRHNDLNELRDISVTLFDKMFVLQRNGSVQKPNAAFGRPALAQPAFGQAVPPAVPTQPTFRQASPTQLLFGKPVPTTPPAFVQGVPMQSAFNFASADHYTSSLDIQSEEKTLHHISGVQVGGTRIHVQNHKLMWTNNKEIIVYELQCKH